MLRTYNWQPTPSDRDLNKLGLSCAKLSISWSLSSLFGFGSKKWILADGELGWVEWLNRFEMRLNLSYFGELSRNAEFQLPRLCLSCISLVEKRSN